MIFFFFCLFILFIQYIQNFKWKKYVKLIYPLKLKLYISLLYFIIVIVIYDACVCVPYSGSELLHHQRENGRRRRDEANRPGVVLVRGHGRTVRVPEAEDPLPSAGRGAGRAALSPDRQGQHRVRPDLHAGAAGHRRQQRQQARVSRQAHDRRVSRARRGHRRFAQTPSTGQGECVSLLRVSIDYYYYLLPYGLLWHRRLQHRDVIMFVQIVRAV